MAGLRFVQDHDPNFHGPHPPLLWPAYCCLQVRREVTGLKPSELPMVLVAFALAGPGSCSPRLVRALATGMRKSLASMSPQVRGGGVACVREVGR